MVCASRSVINGIDLLVSSSAEGLEV